MKLKDKLYYSQKGIKVNKQKTAKQELNTLTWATKLGVKMEGHVDQTLYHPNITKSESNKILKLERI